MNDNHLLVRIHQMKNYRLQNYTFCLDLCNFRKFPCTYLRSLCILWIISELMQNHTTLTLCYLAVTIQTFVIIS